MNFYFLILTLDNSDFIAFRLWSSNFIGSTGWVSTSYSNVMMLDDVI